jgi:hypothetical protein
MSSQGSNDDVFGQTVDVMTHMKRWTQPVDEGIGELTGRNLQRRAMNEANDKTAAAEKKIKWELAMKREQDMQADINASQAAKAAQDTGKAIDANLMNTTKVPKNWANQYMGGSDQGDFLGL